MARAKTGVNHGGTRLTEDDLTLFYEVSTSIHAIRDLDEMLQSILVRIKTVFSVEGASLALHDAERSEFYFIRTVEEEMDGDHERKKKMRFPDHLGVAGWVLREKLFLSYSLEDKKLVRILYNLSTSMGLLRCSFIPESRLFWTSSFIAFAVKAIIGIFLSVFLMVLAAS